YIRSRRLWQSWSWLLEGDSAHIVKQTSRDVIDQPTTIPGSHIFDDDNTSWWSIPAVYMAGNCKKTILFALIIVTINCIYSWCIFINSCNWLRLEKVVFCYEV